MYALASPALIAGKRDAVTRAVLEGLRVKPSAAHAVTISESSAWLDYRAVGEVWDRRSPPTLPEPVDAKNAAEAALTRLERSCSPLNPQWRKSLGEIRLLPPVSLLRPASLHAVARPDGSAWDHWLYRGEPRLLVDGGARRRAGVLGAQIEVRIGHNGQVVSVRSRWRPMTGEKILVETTPFRPREPDGSGESSRQPPSLNYVLDGDGVPQFYLAPYWLDTDGHDILTTSASKWSLTVDIGRVQQNNSRMTLMALAQGGSGHYRYNWAAYALAEFAHGIRELGPGRASSVATTDGKALASSIDLDNGHYVVLVNVKDHCSGAFRHVQQQVFSAPWGSDSTSARVS
jgi:hypothetical protein